MMLQLSKLTLFREGQPVLQELDLRIAPGQGVLASGPNGSGKTTLLRTVCGWRPTYAGSITWRGRSLKSARDALRAELVFLGHLDGLHEDMSPRENLCWLASMGGEAPSPSDIDQALGEMGMLDLAAQPVRLLSRGQRRSAALSIFFLTRKQLWVLDEPLAALDVEGQQHFRSRVMGHLHAGGFAFLSCHTDSWPHHTSLQQLSLPARPSSAI